MVQQSFEEMDLVLNREDPWEDMHGIRFVLRDTAPAVEMRADFRKYREEQVMFWPLVCFLMCNLFLTFCAQKNRLQETKFKEHPRGRRNPVAAWPSELLFFFRVILLLRGLCAGLGVRIPYLKTLTPFARMALLQAFPRSAHAKVGDKKNCGFFTDLNDGTQNRRWCLCLRGRWRWRTRVSKRPSTAFSFACTALAM
jgi:hypothetical protein